MYFKRFYFFICVCAFQLIHVRFNCPCTLLKYHRNVCTVNDIWWLPRNIIQMFSAQVFWASYWLFYISYWFVLLIHSSYMLFLLHFFLSNLIFKCFVSSAYPLQKLKKLCLFKIQSGHTLLFRVFHYVSSVSVKYLWPLVNNKMESLKSYWKFFVQRIY